MICGIDPGLSGAISFIDGDKVEVYDMPTITVTKGKKKVRSVNIPLLHEMLAGMNPKVVVLEQVHAMPGQGVTSMFRFGEAYGIVQAVVACCGYPLELVTPQKWKKAMGLSKDKGASRLLATRYYPDYADKWARAKDDGRAEAVLIARWYNGN